MEMATKEKATSNLILISSFWLIIWMHKVIWKLLWKDYHLKNKGKPESVSRRMKFTKEETIKLGELVAKI